MPALDPALRGALRGGLGLVLLAAAAPKLRDPARFRAALAGYALLPPRAESPAAAALVAAEVAAGAALLAPGSGPAPALAAAALFALYAAAIAANLARGRRDVDCGCGGPASRRPLGEGLVARNAALVLAAAAAALPASLRATVWIDAASGVGGALALALLYAAADAALANAPRLAAARRETWSRP
jgi:Methylamine utilisation protein MauE